MRLLVSFIVCFLFSISVSGQEVENKTFLVLFKTKELSKVNTSLKSIQDQFSSFATKTYSGNSDPALLIEVPSCDFDECFLGNFLIENDKGKNFQLQEIALRLFDLTENQKTLQAFLSSYEESIEKRKNTKAE
ncbi:hypothetical protein [Algoriphagus sp. CAU 1675]|uniref:hypothetical protein n=1 Tax=Algoriphagus sp. CAU 1675 TaxID=3032597 RepID=UPI0023DA29AA|nr:hypothetical protein [Algoriphagus sp. CAU 1675]MDF2158349.1 hypothetical protein [Algoriphagus sp. CAU 1675]